MKSIVIKRLSLLNFKGIRNLTVDFDEYETSVFGANGTGKTTLFDAFTWVLFGKDSSDRKEFNIKTLDKDNRAIERIPHEVAACIEVNGEEINLKKCYSEVWKRTRGSAEEKFSGHSVECFYNDVPCSIGEYTKKIADICDEQVFKLITSPQYFVSQKKEFQRNMLLSLIGGNVSDEMLIGYNPDFAGIVKMLSGKTIDELKREVASKKKKIKEGIEGIPARIDERKRTMPEVLDWAILERDIKKSEDKITELQGQIKDRTMSYNEANKQHQEIVKQLANTRNQITKREYELKESLLSDYNNKIREHENCLVQVSRLENERNLQEIKLPRLNIELEGLQKKRESLLEEWAEIKANKLVFNEDEFCCPVCHRPFETEDIEAKKEQMTADFNADIAARKENNKAKGLEIKTAIESKQKEIKDVNDAVFKYNVQIEEIKASKLYNEIPDEPYIQPFIESDAELVSLRKYESELQSKIDSGIEVPDTNDLLEKLKEEQELIQNNKIFLEDRNIIDENNKRIAELEKELSESQAQYAELEGIEYNLFQYSKTKMEMVESKINDLFSLVKFKLFEQQINGGEIETCEAMVDGVPYSDLNKAKKCNAGLDIINTISSIYGIKAPVFIDNRESISELCNNPSQIINLIVDKNCKTLKIE